MVFDAIIYALLMVIFLIVGGVAAYRLVEREDSSAKRPATNAPPGSDDSPLRSDNPQLRTDQRPDWERKRII